MNADGATVVSFDVSGTPAPKGSARAFVSGGRAVLAPGGSSQNREKIKSWAAAVRHGAVGAVGDRTEPVFIQTPLMVEIVFRLSRPGGHWGRSGLRRTAPAAPATKPDLDKLVRATLDALTGLVFDDDSRIVRVVAEKSYAQPGHEGATVLVRPV